MGEVTGSSPVETTNSYQSSRQIIPLRGDESITDIFFVKAGPQISSLQRFNGERVKTLSTANETETRPASERIGVWPEWGLPLILFVALHFVTGSASVLAIPNEKTEAVCSSVDGQTMLVIIDMQNQSVKHAKKRMSEGNQKKLNEAIQAQVRAIEAAMSRNLPIAIIQYKGKGPTLEPIHEAVRGYHNVRFFKKDTDGMLDPRNDYRAPLVQFMRSKRISEFVLSGANGGACVHRSLLEALERGCKVTTIPEAIIDLQHDEFIHPYSHLALRRIEKSDLESGRFQERSLERAFDARNHPFQNEHEAAVDKAK